MLLKSFNTSIISVHKGGQLASITKIKGSKVYSLCVNIGNFDTDTEGVIPHKVVLLILTVNSIRKMKLQLLDACT